MKNRGWLLLPVVVFLAVSTTAALAAPPRHPDAEVGLLVGGNWADKDLAGDGDGKDASLWIGGRLARDIGRNWNFFVDGGYASHEAPIPTEDLSLLEARLGFEKLFPMGVEGRTSLFLAGAVGGADAGMPSPIDDFQRPLLSGGVGLLRTFDSGNRFRMELRAEELMGDEGLSGADITNIQLLFGYTFGLFEKKGESDSDGDGVADSKDACRNTPHGALVDSRGCPMDSDGDGVYDGIDRCPNTPRGTEVDAKGCPKKKIFEEGKKSLVLEGVNFEFDSAKLTSDSYETLDRVAASLKEWSEIEVEVGGHTDSEGDDEYNRKLSQERAQAVRDYLVSKGVSSSRLTAKGYGESHPVADNGTAEGRAKNRRVELTKLGD